MKFIYVFDKDVKERLIKLGYSLLKDDIAKSVFVFEANDSLNFELSDKEFVYSDTLSF